MTEGMPTDAMSPIALFMQADIAFRRPAKLDDALRVLSEVLEVRAASCVIHQRVMREDELIAEAKIMAAFLSPEGRPKRQPREWVEKFERLKKEGVE